MKTLREYPYEAGRTLYPIDFELGILDRGHVFVFVGEDYTVQETYTWINDGQISLSTPILPDEKLTIRRIVPKSELTNDYENRARLSEKNLNDSFKQALMILEEFTDGLIAETEPWVINTLTLFNKGLQLGGNLDMQGNRIINLAEPIESLDATTKRYVDLSLFKLKEELSTIGQNFELDHRVESKLVSELDGGVFVLSTFEYSLGKEELVVLYNGSEIFDYTEVNTTSISLNITGMESDDEITIKNTRVKKSDNGSSGYATYLNITLEQFDPSAGTGGDDTAAWQQAIALSNTTGYGIQLLAKTYQIDSISTAGPYYQIKSCLIGVGMKQSKIILRTPLADARTGLLLPFSQLDGVKFEDFSYDCSLSDDPIDWNANYDNFQGSRGLFIYDSDNISIKNVYASNVMQAGFALYNVRGAHIQHCFTNRTRGNFGDGFYNTGRNHLIENCKAYDFTRIGFVVETNLEQDYISRNFQFNNCVAEYGHDSSILYSGIEYNAGFWFENYIQAACYRCSALRYRDRGFVVANSYFGSGFPNIPADMAKYLYTETTFDSCHVDGGDIAVPYGFTIGSLNKGLRPSVRIVNCTGVDATKLVYIAGSDDDRCKVIVDQCHSVLTALSVDDSTCSLVMHLGSQLFLSNSTIQYKAFNQASWDSSLLAYAVVNEFGTDAGYEAIIENVKALDVDENEIAIKIKFGNNQSRARRKLVVRDCKIEQDETFVKSALFENCNFTLLGSTVADRVTYERCVIENTKGTGLARRPVVSISGGTVDINDCNFDFTESGGYLYLYNIDNLTDKPKVNIRGGSITKNVEADSYMVRINADPTITDTADVHNYYVSNMHFINTGGTTTNPIVFSDQAPATNVTVYGSGNYKSSTLTVDASANVIANF